MYEVAALSEGALRREGVARANGDKKLNRGIGSFCFGKFHMLIICF